MEHSDADPAETQVIGNYFVVMWPKSTKHTTTEICVSVTRIDRPTDLPIASTQVCPLNNVSSTSRPDRGYLGPTHDTAKHMSTSDHPMGRGTRDRTL